MRPFRFALQGSSAGTGSAWRQLARQVESLGYSTLYIPDHFGDQWGPIVAMTVAAEATTTLNVGSLVFDNDYRHPVVLAKEIATLDLASEGRVEFGLGAGWMRADYDEAGLAYDSAGTRIERMVEGLAIMKDLWAEGSSTRSGRHYTVNAAQGLPRPHSVPYPKLIIGGGSPKVLSIAAQQADIVGINPNLAAGHVGKETAASALAERFDQRVEWVKKAAGDRFEDLDLQILTFVVQVVPNRDEVIASVAPFFGVDAEQAADVPIALVGTVDEICEILIERRVRFGFNYVVVHEAELEAFAPVVARLAGT
ncbi:MAG: TIGR03621 family F420-dependent LLM class oxidoreductase [Acidimicrobiales bacterium]